MKLLIDMNLSPKWVSVLKKAGLEAAHWSRIGRPNAPDYEILEYARSNGYVVFMPIRLTQVGTLGYDPAHVRLPLDYVGVQHLFPDETA